MNIDIVRAHYAASAQGNIGQMMADVSPQVRWTEMAGFPCAGTWVGPQAVPNFFLSDISATDINYAINMIFS